MLYHLQNKHHVDDISGLLEIQANLENQIFLANNLEEEIATAKENLKRAEEDLKKQAELLSNKRKAVFSPLAKEIMALLKQLGMPDAKLEIVHKTKEPGTNGIDEITILFSANKGIAPAPISKIASGGEFSRLMLCFKYVMASKTSLPTMVFDEIDAGISGEIALQMGSMLEDLSKQHQVITISHLPQIAARGKAHYFVYKDVDNDRSVSRIRKLSDEEKVSEIAKMISGDNPTESAKASAKELISMSS
jgi:DNA repair protein RecN (Recombination protein N)